MLRNEHCSLSVQVGWRRLGSTRPYSQREAGSRESQASGTLSPLSNQTKDMELEAPMVFV